MGLIHYCLNQVKSTDLEGFMGAHQFESAIRPAFLPDMAEGEILYSWTGQYHRLSGNVRHNLSSIQLFGDDISGFRKDFPSQLDHFAALTKCVFGDAETLAYERSLLGFFAPFQPKEIVSKTLQKMKSNSIKLLKAELGVLVSGLGTSNQLKACPDCMKEDIESFGITKWYQEHQWPVSWVCRKHHRPLYVVKRELITARKLLLPQDILRWEAVPVLSMEHLKKLAKAVSFCANFARHRNYNLDSVVLRYTYLLGAKRRDWIRTDGALRSDKLWSSFLNHYQGLEKLPGIASRSEELNDSFITALLRKQECRQHPIRHFLLMAFLFDSPRDFEANYELVKTAFMNGGMPCVRELFNVGWRDELRRLIEEESLSVSAAAKALSIELHWATCIVKKDGVNYRKPFIFDEENEKKLRQLLGQGVDRMEILKEIGIRSTFLNAYLRKQPYLREIWRKKILELIILESRKNYKIILNNRQIDFVSQLERFPKIRFRWLRKYDFEWLVANSQPRVAAILLANKNGTDNIK